MGTKKDIVCPCGKLLGSTTVTRGGGEKICTACKRRIKFVASHNGVKTSVKN